jgi:septal ring factor EnvC (AmiA/AmiB activator)
MRGNAHATRLALVVAAAMLAGSLEAAEGGDDRAKRLSTLQNEMMRLQREMAGLDARERSVLGDVTRMDTEIALRRTQLEDVSLRLKDTEERLAGSERELASIQAEQAVRAPRLATRIREVYKRGPAGLLARVLGPLEGAESLDGFRYASYLSRRDASQLAAWRASSIRLASEREVLGAERERLSALRTESSRRESELSASRASRASLLARIRGDREQHQQALGELEDAARNLGRLVESFGDQPAHAVLDVRKFRGLIDWPADGPVSAKFGSVIHPKFKTAVPHPGLDIDAAEGQPFRSVFDGRIAYAAPLSGYGLTVVVDHGNGVVSIYAHAQVLVVEAGQDVARGQELGKVGDSGSLRGPYLYFELRQAGHPVDPAAWLRPR